MTRTTFFEFYHEVQELYGKKSGVFATRKQKLRDVIDFEIIERRKLGGKITSKHFQEFWEDVLQLINLDAENGGVTVKIRSSENTSNNIYDNLNGRVGGGSKEICSAIHYYFICKGLKSDAFRGLQAAVFSDQAEQYSQEAFEKQFPEGFVDLTELHDYVENVVPTAPFEWPPYVLESDIKSRDYSVDDGVWLNPHNHFSIPLRGREKELQTLREFLEDPTKNLICALIAPSGAGKTRLVSEWMKSYIASKHQGEWDAGFVKSSSIDGWIDWEPQRNTIVVIDYVSNYGAVAEEIYKKFAMELKYKIRLLVIDHIYPEFLDKHHYWSRHFPDQGKIDSYSRQRLFGKSPIYLIEQNRDKNLISTIISDVARGGSGAQIALDDIRSATDGLFRMSEDAKNPDSIVHPLFAALMGQALRDGIDFSNWSRRDLLKHYFDKRDRLPWRSKSSSVEGDRHHDFERRIWLSHIVCLATLFRGITIEKARILIPNDVKSTSIEDEIERGLKSFDIIIQQAQSIVSSDENQTIKPYEPDILGETFIIFFLDFIIDRKQTTDDFVQVLSKFDDFDFREFENTIVRLVRNLSNDNQDRDDVKNAWDAVLRFLTEQEFKNNVRIEILFQFAIISVSAEMLERKDEYHAALFFRKLKSENLIRYISEVISHRLYTEKMPAYLNLLFFFDGLAESAVLNNLIIAIDEELESRGLGNLLELSVFYKHEYLFSYYMENIDSIRSGKSQKIENVFLNACKVGNETIIGQIVERFRELDVNNTANNGTTPLISSINSQNVNAILLLLSIGADVNLCSLERNWSPLMEACVLGNLDVINLLIFRGASLEEREAEGGRTALMHACSHGHLAVVKRLLSLGANVHQTTPLGYSLLQMAVNSDHFDVAELLLENGFDIDFNVPGSEMVGNALTGASQLNKIRAVEFLLSKGANPNFCIPANGASSLMIAAQSGFIDVVKKLIQAGADINQPTFDGGWPITAATERKNLDVVRALILAGADLGVKHNGIPFVAYFIMSDMHELSDLVFERVTDINAKFVLRQGDDAHSFHKEYNYLEFAKLIGNQSMISKITERGGKPRQ